MGEPKLDGWLDDEPVVCVLMLNAFGAASWSESATAPWDRTRRAAIPWLVSRKT